jgi:hypothetical protein
MMKTTGKLAYGKVFVAEFAGLASIAAATLAQLI